MRLFIRLLLALIVLSPSWARALAEPFALGDHCKLRFATVAEGKAILTSEDDYTRRLSPLERRLKLSSTKPVTDEQYRAAIGRDIGEWPDASAKSVREVLESLRPRLLPYASLLPEDVFLIFTNNKTEGGLPYTRGNGVVLPGRECAGTEERLRHVIVHELFHVLSRRNPEARDRLYTAIGFDKCKPLKTTPEIARIQLTNPDCPLVEHCIRITVDKEQRFAVPFPSLDTGKAAAQPGKSFMHYVDLKLLLVNRHPLDSSLTPSMKDGKLELVNFADVSGFFETIGKNTHYIFHPEEILAENFVHLIEETPDLPSPKITVKIEKLLLAAAKKQKEN